MNIPIIHSYLKPIRCGCWLIDYKVALAADNCIVILDISNGSFQDEWCYDELPFQAQVHPIYFMCTVPQKQIPSYRSLVMQTKTGLILIWLLTLSSNNEPIKLKFTNSYKIDTGFTKIAFTSVAMNQFYCMNQQHAEIHHYNTFFGTIITKYKLQTKQCENITCLLYYNIDSTQNIIAGYEGCYLIHFLKDKHGQMVKKNQHQFKTEQQIKIILQLQNINQQKIAICLFHDSIHIMDKFNFKVICTIDPALHYTTILHHIKLNKSLIANQNTIAYLDHNNKHKMISKINSKKINQLISTPTAVIVLYDLHKILYMDLPFL